MTQGAVFTVTSQEFLQVEIDSAQLYMHLFFVFLTCFLSLE